MSGRGTNRIKTIYIEPGSPWQNGFVESFHGRFRDECLNREQLWTLTETRVVVGDYRQKYNQVRPHSRLGYESPAVFAAGRQETNKKHKLNHVPGLTHGLAQKSEPGHGTVIFDWVLMRLITFGDRKMLSINSTMVASHHSMRSRTP